MKSSTVIAIGLGVGVVAIVGIALARKAGSRAKTECLKAAAVARPTEDEVRAFIRAKGLESRVVAVLPTPNRSVYDVYSMKDGSFFYLSWTSDPMRWAVNDEGNSEFSKWLLEARCG